jgi:dihydropteroate synthase
MDYIRPIPLTGPAVPPHAQRLAGGWCRFTHVEVLRRDAAPRVIDARDADTAALTAPRAALRGIALDRPRIMGILNVTPDSFSDGGRFQSTGALLQTARAMAGADILDIGGESTRPGAEEVPETVERDRVVPAIRTLREAGIGTPISIDTRKAAVARAAMAAGASILNDVSALTFDPGLAPFAAMQRLPVILMHAQGTPATMQERPAYDDVVLDVYDALATRVQAAVAAGIARDRIVIDPGIGFGKTQAHNLALLARLSLFHGLGLPVLLGASRKKFIGALTDEPQADRRLPGSLAVALHAVGQGVQVLRVHDVAETRGALTVWQAMTGNAA